MSIPIFSAIGRILKLSVPDAKKFEDENVDMSDLAKSEIIASYQAVCRGLDHETRVMNDRLTWAILYCGAIFTASSFIITSIVSADHAAQKLLLYILLLGLACTGIFFSRRTQAGVDAAQSQFDLLRQFNYARRKHYIELHLPIPHGDQDDHIRGNAVSLVFPRLMLVTWTAIAAVEILLILVNLISVLLQLWPVTEIAS